MPGKDMSSAAITEQELVWCTNICPQFICQLLAEIPLPSPARIQFNCSSWLVIWISFDLSCQVCGRQEVTSYAIPDTKRIPVRNHRINAWRIQIVRKRMPWRAGSK